MPSPTILNQYVSFNNLPKGWSKGCTTSDFTYYVYRDTDGAFVIPEYGDGRKKPYLVDNPDLSSHGFILVEFYGDPLQ